MSNIVGRMQLLSHPWVLALGRGGLLWASAAAALGALCCVISLATMILSPNLADLHADQHQERQVLAFDKASHRLMRAIAGVTSSHVAVVEGETPVHDAWARFERALSAICADLDPEVPSIERLRAVCRPSDPFRDQMAAAIADFHPPERPFAAAALRGFQAVRDDVIALADYVMRRNAVLEGELVAAYERTKLVQLLSGLGFAGSGLILLLLVGRASMRHLAKAEEAAATRDLLQETIESLPAGLVLYDKDERLVLFNGIAAEISPVLQRADALGKTYAQISREMAELAAAMGLKVSDAEQKDWVERFRRKDVPHVYRLPDGRWFEWVGKTTRSGRTVGLRVEVTALKRQEIALQAARARYRSLVDSMSDTVYALDDRGRFVFASPSALTLFGVAPDQLVGRRLTDFVPAEDVQSVIEHGRAFFRSNNQEVRQRAIRIRTVDGEIRHVEVRCRKPTGAETAGTAQVGIMRDVTVAVRMTQRLEEERSHLRSVVESSGAQLVLTDCDLRVQMANREFWKSRALDADALTGRPLTELVDCKLDPAVLAAWRRGPLTPDQASPVRYSKTILDAEGRQRALNITAKPVVGDDGMMRQVVFLGVDDTERFEAEKALFDADRLSTLGEMAATVAHELRQPLQVIALASSSALEEIGDATDHDGAPDAAFLTKKMERINGQVERADRIIDELRVYARGTAGEQPQAFDPAAAIASAVDMTAASARDARMKVGVSLADALPAVTGHASRLEQVLINLINNARDAGGHAVDVAAVVETDQGNRRLRITVGDDGPGIPAHVLPRLFNSFVTTKPAGKGTGLGLRICRRIVEEMGGSIAAANRPDGGAEFAIVLPAGEAAAPDPTQ